MGASLEDLLADTRLARLFQEDRCCALQLWILQVKGMGANETEVENRLLYGRLLPYNHASDKWHATEDDHFQSIGEHRAQVIQANLYFRGRHAASLLKHLGNGENLREVSHAIGFVLNGALAVRIGHLRLGQDLHHRTVAYLPNRDSWIPGGRLSPHGSASALSASLFPGDKRALIQLEDRKTERELLKFVVERLKEMTGLDFGGLDGSRLGDLELLVFPTLDDRERELLHLAREEEQFSVHLDPQQLPGYRRFAVRLALFNAGEVVHSAIITASCDAAGSVDCRFAVPELLLPILEGVQVEIHGFHANDVHGSLCCRWQVGFIRQPVMEMHMVGAGQPTVRSSWLERFTRSATAAARLKAAQTVSQGRTQSTVRAGGWKYDPWVPLNRELAVWFERLRPQPSDGRFFEKLSENSLGRLEFVEWFKRQLGKYDRHEVVLFDPYFEDAGAWLIIPNAKPSGRYVVFTTLPKPSEEQSGDGTEPSRIDNLLASCERMRPLLGNVRFQIYGLKAGALHDRYMLFIGDDEIPAAGFHLSNSIQKSNESFPLLITPIPQDVLWKVCDYSGAMLEKAFAPVEGTESPKVQLIFDSQAGRTARVLPSARLTFLDRVNAGDVLAAWTGDDSLRGLSREGLRERMRVLGFLQGDSLTIKDAPGFVGCIHLLKAPEFTQCAESWEIMAWLQACTSTGNEVVGAESSQDQGSQSFLARFLETRFDRALPASSPKTITHTSSAFLLNTLEELLRTNYWVERMCDVAKPAALEWTDFFAIRILWAHSPDVLISLMERRVTPSLDDENPAHTLSLCVLSQILSEIGLGVMFALTERQRQRLLTSSLGVLRWMGLNALERRISQPEGLNVLIRGVSSLVYEERVLALGWMVARFDQARMEAATIQGLIEALWNVLPPTLSKSDLELMIRAMRCHRHRLGQCEPQLFQAVLRPLLEQRRVTSDDACEIWMSELMAYLEDVLQGLGGGFQRGSEGLTTENAAQLFSQSTSKKQRETLKPLKGMLAKVRRTIQQPLANTVDWTRWHRSLIVALWLHAFAKWAASFLAGGSEIRDELNQFAVDTKQVALARSISDWRSDRVSYGHLVRFLEEVALLSD